MSTDRVIFMQSRMKISTKISQFRLLIFPETFCNMKTVLVSIQSENLFVFNQYFKKAQQMYLNI